MIECEILPKTPMRVRLADALEAYGFGELKLKHSDGRPIYGSIHDKDYARALSEWLREHTQLPEDKYDSLALIRNLPQICVEAFDDKRSEKRWSHLPSLVDVRDRDQGFAARDLKELLPPTVQTLMPPGWTSDWVGERLQSYFGAQWSVVSQSWMSFVRTCYREMMLRIKVETHRGNKGKFGGTTLMTWCCAGRCMIQFERPSGHLTYVADDSDMWGYRAGPNTPSADYRQCVTMIDDVVEHWDLKKLRPDTKVGMGL